MAQIYLDPRYLHQHREPLRESSDPSHERSRCFQVFYPDHAGNGGTSKPPFKAGGAPLAPRMSSPEKSLSGKLVYAIYTDPLNSLAC